jgi:putative DNA primase/helicase
MLTAVHEHRFGEHRREDLITRVTNASYDPDAKAPRWVQFLQEITDDDAELVRYLAQLAGLGLTGVTQDHLFIVLWGDGANGKSVFLETLAYVLGGYAKMADVSTFVATKDNRIRNDIARLHGARLVTANESEQGQRLAEALIKQLTGGDTVSARFLYEESFEFKPQAKFWLRTNNKPVLRGQDDGIWRRVRLVPFDVQIPEDNQDKKLPQKLQGEASGVLNWALGGLRDYLVNGLQTPRKVSDATRQYREDQDLVQHFIDERCQVDLNATVGKTELYEAYRAWTEAEKVFTKNQPEFREEMLRRNFDEGKTGSRRFWRGLKLKRSEAQAQHCNEYTDNAPDGVL